MTTKRFFYIRDSSFTTSGEGVTNDTSPEGKLERHTGDNDDDDKDDDLEFMQDVPYSSSSIDRSSIGSIPWADDAIKQNQLDWDRVERMLCGEEMLPEEPELRHEILEWQRKFPRLVGAKAKQLRQHSFDNSALTLNDTLDMDSLSSLSLNSLDGEDDDEDTLTPTSRRDYARKDSQYSEDVEPLYKFNPVIADDLPHILNRALHITSVPLAMRRRRSLKDRDFIETPKYEQSNDSTPRNSPRKLSFDTSVPSATPPPAPLHRTSAKSSLMVMKSPHGVSSANATTGAIRMPPILNVIDCKRRFRGFNNRSFVQLTNVQKTKSAAVTHHHQPRSSKIAMGNQSAWQMPLATASMSSRFINNRNAIVLPAINMQSIREHHNSTSTNSDGAIDSRNWMTTTLNASGRMNGRRQRTFATQQLFNGVNSSTTPSTGRSVSAAVHHPRMEFSAFYLPYSATKFKAFK